MKGSWLLTVVYVGALTLRAGSADHLTGDAVGPQHNPSKRPDGVVVEGNGVAATSAWNRAYRHARSSQRWQDLVEVGDASRRSGAVAESSEPFEARAREAYRSALARARQQGSLDGVLRVGDALAALGDRDGVQECLRAAELLAAADPDARADVGAFAAQVADLLPRQAGSAKVGSLD